MGAKKKEDTVEYKETEIFELFPKFSYTAMQKKRVILFHGYGKNCKKLINYAAKFDVRNKICLVYLVGEVREGMIEAVLEANGCSDRVCVVTADFPAREMEIWERYDELRTSLIGFGAWDKERDRPSDEYARERKKQRDYYAGWMDGGVDGQIGFAGASEDYGDCERMVNEYDSMVETVRRYEKLKERCAKSYFREFRLHRAGHLEKPYNHGRLDGLIKKIFPYGAEAMGCDGYAALSPASIDTAIEFGKTGALTGKLKLTGEMIEPAVKALVSLITRCISEKGYCSIEEVAELMELPPFGFGYDGFSAACVARAISKFGNRRLLFYDGCGTFDAKGIEKAVYESAFDPQLKSRRRRRLAGKTSCLYLESQPHKKVKQFMARLWGIKIEMPGVMMGMHLGRDLCKSHRVPLSYIDERLLHLTLWDVDFWDRAQVDALAKDIDENGDEILAAYERYTDANESVPPDAGTLLNVDYSWCWSSEEYERILYLTEKYGPWPWSSETQRAVNRERGWRV